ncbi:MAG TPA: hypothetical protein VGF87_05470 [Acidimicrobiales bacterium]
MSNGTPTLASALAEHFAVAGIPPDGGDSEHFAVVRIIGNIPYPIPNTAARKRAVKIHDFNHIVSGYATDKVGELEISAWELASGGCQRFTAAWVLDLGGLIGGLMVAPRRTCRAFVRGRRQQNLYSLALETLQPMPVAEAHALVETPVPDVWRRVPMPLHLTAMVVAALPATAAMSALWFVAVPAWLIDRRRRSATAAAEGSM